MSEHETQYFADQHRVRADSAYRHAGLGEAPRRMSNEDLTAYRVRLLAPLKAASPTWRGLDVAALAGLARAGGLQVAETQIYADAVSHGRESGSGTGPLREVKEIDQSGRPITKFYGDPAHCWGPFKAPTGIGRFTRPGAR